MFKILHLADIHMGSGFSHGQVNPETGINSRLEDFERTLGLCMDRAIAEPVDLVIFAGDAFPDATPAPYVQKAFASQFRRLADTAPGDEFCAAHAVARGPVFFRRRSHSPARHRRGR